MKAWLQEIIDWITKNKDALNWLFGSGIVLVVLGGIYKLIVWILKRWRARKIRSTEFFPFKIIPPNSNLAKEILGGDDNDLLADRNIPYQQRVSARSIRREIEDLLSQHQWVLIVGKTGLGKTRETINIAESLSKEGWTILYLTREKWLTAPSKLPEGVPERKLLFILDDLNRKVYASRVEQAPTAKENLLQPLTQPLQERLLETLETFEKLCGKNEILVIGTARDEKFSEFDGEPSEWDKLEYDKYNDFWKRFTIYTLPEAEDEAEINLLSAATRIANINSDPSEFPLIAKRNDGTFANLVENLRTVSHKNIPLHAHTYRETLKGTWEKRFQDAIKKYHFAKYFYDGVDLARAVGLQMTFQNVYSIALIIANKDLSRLNFIKNRLFLRYLIRTENLISPRDGQVEAKGYRININDYVLKLYKLVLWNYSSNMLFNQIFDLSLHLDIIPKRYFMEDTFSTIDFILNIFLDADWILRILGRAYIELGFAEHGIYYLKKSISLNCPDNPKWLRNLRTKSLGVAWKQLGLGYLKINQEENSIIAFKKAIEILPKDSDNWYFLGEIYSHRGKPDDAIDAFQKAIIMNPKDSFPWIGLGDLYSELSQYEKALSSHLKAIAIKPKDPYPWNHLSEFYRCHNHYTKALETVEKAIELNPKFATSWNTLGNINADQNNLDKAKNAYLKAIKLNEDPIWWCNLGIIYVREDQNDDALIAFTNALKNNPKSIYAHISIATCLLKSGRSYDANLHLKEAEQLLGTSIEYYKACFESVNGNKDKAFFFLSSSIKRLDTSILWTRYDPNFLFIRNDPRFKELVGEDENSTE
jgi:tetratricopeptide (TPR) repeat protein